MQKRPKVTVDVDMVKPKIGFVRGGFVEEIVDKLHVIQDVELQDHHVVVFEQELHVS